MKARILLSTIAITAIVILVVGVALQSERMPLLHLPWMPLGVIGAFVVTAVALKRVP